jgi:hypothetical protein
MKSLGLLPAQIKIIVGDPSQLASPSSIGLAPSAATFILDNGYTKGFRILFILHACLTALATLISVTMIKHKTLTRSGESQEGSSAVVEEGSLSGGYVDNKKNLHERLPTNIDDTAKSSTANDIEMGSMGPDIRP